MHELTARLDEIARTPVLLVASDFDGTISPIVPEPDLAEADREAVGALDALAGTPRTHVAIISGRTLADLFSRTREIGHAHLVGGHGSEFAAGVASPLSKEARETHARVLAELRRIGATDPGFGVEVKPTSVALHYRNVGDATGEAAVAAVLVGPGRWPGVYVRQGKKVVELSVIEANKGTALQALRRRLGATGVVFVGDDVTDEDAFGVLGGPDVGVKVGPGPTRAGYRVADTREAAHVLSRLAEWRVAWLAKRG